MSLKNKSFADDGWAIWVSGDDTSTVYFDDWLNPRGKSYIDIAVKVVGIRKTESLNIYFPFRVSSADIKDISLDLHYEKMSRAIFSSMCIVDFKKNPMTSEIAYNGKTVDIVHISEMDYTIENISAGTLLSISFSQLKEYLDNDEAYFYFRVPHKSLDVIFRNHVRVGNVFKRMFVLISTPFISEKYGYSVRINEARFLPSEINRIGEFHRQKLKKSVISISIADGYELNDAGCYKVRRLEQELYKDFLPEEYKLDDVITYQWQESREENLKGNFNYYFNISRDSISSASMMFYMLVIVVLNAFGGLLWDIIKYVAEALNWW